MKINVFCLVLVSLLAISVIVDCRTSNGGRFGSKRKVVGRMQNRSGNPKNAGTTANIEKIEKIARFAVEEHNKKEKVNLQFVRVLSSKEKVVAGKLYNVVLEARDGITLGKYEAQVLSMSWMNIKQLQEFKHV